MDAIKQQLEVGNVVLLTNLAYSAAGEVLCCNIYDVATHAAIEMAAEKLICMTLKVAAFRRIWDLSIAFRAPFLLLLSLSMLHLASDMYSYPR